VDHVERTRQAFDAFLRRDGIVIGRLLDDQTVWRVPGGSLMSGEYRGREQIFEFLRQTAVLTEGTYRADLRWVAGGDEVVAALYRASGRREGRELDIDQLLVLRYRGSVLAEVLAVPVDLKAFEAFWAA
jgi:ketosteroid isomerase-like protein